jgi:hypothetical protein
MRNNSWLKEHEFFGLFQSPGTQNYRPAEPIAYTQGSDHDIFVKAD